MGLVSLLLLFLSLKEAAGFQFELFHEESNPTQETWSDDDDDLFKKKKRENSKGRRNKLFNLFQDGPVCHSGHSPSPHRATQLWMFFLMAPSWVFLTLKPKQRCEATIISITPESGGVQWPAPDNAALERQKRCEDISWWRRRLWQETSDTTTPVSGSRKECLTRKSSTTIAELGLKSSEAISSLTWN